MATDVQISIILVTSGLFTPLTGEKIKFGDNVILQMCTNYYDHCMCIWVVMVADGQTSIIFVIFWPFRPLPP